MTATDVTSPNPARTKLRLGRRHALAVASLAGLFALPHAASAQLEPPGRKAPAGCMAVTVQRGDTTWAIATANSLSLDEIARLNPQISDLAKIHPGDELAVTCTPGGVALAVPQTVTRDVDVARWLGEREPDGRLTWRSVVAHLYAQGMRGDDLVALASVAECESGRRPEAVGDTTITTKTYGPSYGVMQVRSLNAAKGTGAPRDAEALRGSVEHQMWAAVEVWRSQGMRAWTCALKGWHKPALEPARAAAAEMGL